MHVVLAVPGPNTNWVQGPPTTCDTGTQRIKNSELISTKNTKITPQNSGEINLRIIGSLQHNEMCVALTLKKCFHEPKKNMALTFQISYVMAEELRNPKQFVALTNWKHKF